jgi:hypothetical protein
VYCLIIVWVPCMEANLSGQQVKAPGPSLRTGLPNSRILNKPMALLVFLERTRNSITNLLLGQFMPYEEQASVGEQDVAQPISRQTSSCCNYDPIHIGTCPVDRLNFCHYDPVYITTCPVDHPVFQGCER